MITEEILENCSAWFDSEDIAHFWESDKDGNFLAFYINIGDYDYRISNDEIIYRAEVVIMNEVY